MMRFFSRQRTIDDWLAREPSGIEVTRDNLKDFAYALYRKLDKEIANVYDAAVSLSQTQERIEPDAIKGFARSQLEEIVDKVFEKVKCGNKAKLVSKVKESLDIYTRVVLNIYKAFHLKSKYIKETPLNPRLTGALIGAGVCSLLAVIPKTPIYNSFQQSKSFFAMTLLLSIAAGHATIDYISRLDRQYGRGRNIVAQYQECIQEFYKQREEIINVVISNGCNVP